MCLCIWVCVHVEGRGQCQRHYSLSVSFSLVFLRKAFSLNLEFTESILCGKHFIHWAICPAPKCPSLENCLIRSGPHCIVPFNSFCSTYQSMHSFLEESHHPCFIFHCAPVPRRMYGTQHSFNSINKYMSVSVYVICLVVTSAGLAQHLGSPSQRREGLSVWRIIITYSKF